MRIGRGTNSTVAPARVVVPTLRDHPDPIERWGHSLLTIGGAVRQDVPMATFDASGRVVLTLDELAEAYRITHEYQGWDFDSVSVAEIVLRRCTATPADLHKLADVAKRRDPDLEADAKEQAEYLAESWGSDAGEVHEGQTSILAVHGLTWYKPRP